MAALDRGHRVRLARLHARCSLFDFLFSWWTAIPIYPRGVHLGPGSSTSRRSLTAYQQKLARQRYFSRTKFAHSPRARSGRVRSGAGAGADAGRADDAVELDRWLTAR